MVMYFNGRKSGRIGESHGLKGRVMGKTRVTCGAPAPVDT